MAEFNSFKQFFSNACLLSVYGVLEENRVRIEELSQETIEKVRWMEKFYHVNESNLGNQEDDIPSYQLVKLL